MWSERQGLEHDRLRTAILPHFPPLLRKFLSFIPPQSMGGDRTRGVDASTYRRLELVHMKKRVALSATSKPYSTATPPLSITTPNSPPPLQRTKATSRQCIRLRKRGRHGMPSEGGATVAMCPRHNMQGKQGLVWVGRPRGRIIGQVLIGQDKPPAVPFSEAAGLVSVGTARPFAQKSEPPKGKRTRKHRIRSETGQLGSQPSTRRGAARSHGHDAG